MVVDGEAMGGSTQVRGADGDGAEEDGESRPELTHREPSYKNARWLRKRPGAPRWTQKICRLLEGLMEADETEAETDMGAVVSDLWRYGIFAAALCKSMQGKGAGQSEEPKALCQWAGMQH
jgi:hypothetical protein